MATEKQAKLAREQYSNYLSKNGAHAIAVDYLNNDVSNGFVIIAFVEDDKSTLPKEVEIELKGKITKVPVITEQSPKFKP